MVANQAAQYALRFISGKYQGGEFPLRMDREIVIGRSSDLDMVLVEDMVSRKHAKISTQAGQITIQDLGSTNGTFVNGEKIKKVRLKEGDRILIGTSIIKLVAVDGANVAQLTEAEARSRMDQSAQRRPSGPGRPMSGSIEEIPLPDLLQLLSTSRKSGVLTVRSDLGIGKIYIRKGQIYYASIDDSFDLAPRKAIYRLLTWSSGSFELEPPDERDVLEEIKETTEALLMEGVRQLDELHRIEAELPPRQSMLAMIHPLSPPLRELSAGELDVFQLVVNYGQMQAVIDRSTLTDLETAQAILAVLSRGYIAVTE